MAARIELPKHLLGTKRKGLASLSLAIALGPGLGGCSKEVPIHWIMIESNAQAEGAVWRSLVNKDVGKDFFGGRDFATSFGPHGVLVNYLMPPNSEATQLAKAYRPRWQTADGNVYVVEDVPVASLIPKGILDQARDAGGLPIEVRFAFLPEGRFRMSWRQCPTNACSEGRNPNAGTATEFVGRLETTEAK